MKGSLEVICGSMFSGKTEELMRRLRRAEYAKQDVLTVKHQVDDRGSYTCIVSHDGGKREAYPLQGGIESMIELLEISDGMIDVIGIDEVQFFPDEIIDVIEVMIDRGKRVIISGLDLDFRGDPFGVMPAFLAIGDHITKLQAICMQCGKEAYYTQRLIEGQPAHYHDPTILVGARECYEARCRDCFVILDKPKRSLLREEVLQS